MPIRVIFFLGTSQGDFSEVWVNLTDNSLDSAGQSAKTLGLLRLGLCGEGAKLKKIRVSDITANPRRSKLVPLKGGYDGTPILADKTTWGKVYGTNEEPDQLQTCVLVQCYTSNGQRKPVYLGGIPDDVITTNPIGPNVSVDPQWLGNFKKWADEIQGPGGKWGFYGNDISKPNVPFQNLVLQPGGPGTPVMVVTTQALAFTDQAKLVKVSKVKMTSTRAIKLQGDYFVNSTVENPSGAGTFGYVLGGTEQVDPAQIARGGTVRVVGKAGYAINSVQFTGQVSHKRGGFIAQFRGRRKIRA